MGGLPSPYPVGIGIVYEGTENLSSIREPIWSRDFIFAYSPFREVPYMVTASLIFSFYCEIAGTHNLIGSHIIRMEWIGFAVALYSHLRSQSASGFEFKYPIEGSFHQEHRWLSFSALG